jgi:hypothetical protein
MSDEIKKPEEKELKQSELEQAAGGAIDNFLWFDSSSDSASPRNPPPPPPPPKKRNNLAWINRCGHHKIRSLHRCVESTRYLGLCSPRTVPAASRSKP